jgi:hypothetical protein
MAKNSQTMKSGKKLSKKRTKNQFYYTDDYGEEDYASNTIDDPDEIGTYRSLNDGASVYSNGSISQRSVGQLMKVSYFPPKAVFLEFRIFFSFFLELRKRGSLQVTRPFNSSFGRF